MSGAGPSPSSGGAAAFCNRGSIRLHKALSSDARTCVSASPSVTRRYQFAPLSTSGTLVTFETRSKSHVQEGDIHTRWSRRVKGRESNILIARDGLRFI